MLGPVRRPPDGYGLGRGLRDRATDFIAARECSESLLRRDDAHGHGSYTATVTGGADFGRRNRTGAEE